MHEQQKILRVLRLISLLADKPYRTVKQLALLLETTPKTVYEYLKLLEELGYLVDKDRHNAYFIFEARKTEADSLIPEELQLVNQLVDTIPVENPLRESLRKKLYLASTLVPLVDDLADRHVAKIVQQLSEAIKDKRRVKLLRYQSATGNAPKDRLVEPLSFQKSHSQLSAFDVEQQEIRHFKVKRIEAIEVQHTLCSFDPHAFPTDMFGFTSQQTLLVKLGLSQRAYRLLIEEFPEAKPFTNLQGSSSTFPYRFVYEARSAIGIGRFILGIPGEVEIESPSELTDYLKKRVQEYTFTEVVNGLS